MSTSEPFDYRLSAQEIAPRLAALGGLVWLDSAWRDGAQGRYSYLMANPSLTLAELAGRAGTTLTDGCAPAHTAVVANCDPLQAAALVLRGAAEPLRAAGGVSGTPRDLPPFRGGWAGYLGYDWGAAQHGVLAPRSAPEDAVPLVHLAWYNWVMVWDHLRREAWLIVRDMRPHFASLAASLTASLTASPAAAVQPPSAAAGHSAGVVRWLSVKREQELRPVYTALAACARDDDAMFRPRRKARARSACG
jgi:para-aminobenzoate synthetase component 1